MKTVVVSGAPIPPEPSAFTSTVYSIYGSVSSEKHAIVIEQQNNILLRRDCLTQQTACMLNSETQVNHDQNTI